MTKKIMQLKPTKDSKISLFTKSYTIKAYSFFLLASLIVGIPSQANAGFFDFIIGAKTQAADMVNNNSTSNSQTLPLLGSDPSINPNKKNINDTPDVAIVDNEALSSDNIPLGTDSETNSYIDSSDKITTYIVKKGDTIGGIAVQFNISKNTILYANTNIKNNTLTVGQTLIILPVDGVSYTVKKGDNISSIAKTYKADTKDIAEYNNITDKDLKIGDKIIVPGGTIIKKVIPAPVKIEKEQSQEETNTPSQENNNTAPINGGSNISSGKGIASGYIWPLPSGTGRVSQRLHDDNAYDFAAPKGTPIYAIQDGTVLIADGSGYNGGYGLYVVIDFNDGGQAIFGHMSKVSSYAGETVKQGDIIGYVGSTGRSTGNHVHIGYRGGKPNPYKNLPLGSSD